MTTTDQATELRPLNEPWMRRALQYVYVTRKTTGSGPTIAELCAHMGWRRSSSSHWFRLLKLRKRGLAWEPEVPRSLHVSEAGLAQLKAAQRAAMQAAGKRRAEGGAA